MGRNDIVPEYRTRVHKMAGKWRVDYYMPYGGFLYAEFDTWDEANAEVPKILEQKMWA
jgi:hypothetical protein